MSGIPAGYPYQLMGYPAYSPYMQMPQMPMQVANQQNHSLSTNIASVPAYGTNNIAYAAAGAQTMASLANTNNILTQSYSSLPSLSSLQSLPSSLQNLPPSLLPNPALTQSKVGEAGSRVAEVPPPAELDAADKEEYIKELISERDGIENSNVSNLSKSHVLRLLNQEISRLQGGGIFYGDDVKFMDVYREKCTRVTIRVLVPVREHPKFNFVGKLLGPKGNSLKRMQEETLTKMAVLGRGSMRDREKEEELRASGDPKYGHLQEELHVEITAYAPPAEAYARLAFALTEVRKYLIPDSNDTIRQQQMRELEILSTGMNGLTQTLAGIAGVPNGMAGLSQLPPGLGPESTSQLQLMTSPSILVPSHGYHIPLLPTPPLDTSPSPTITGLPTKYDNEEGEGDSNYKEKMKGRNRKFSPY